MPLEPVGEFQPYLDVLSKSGERTRAVTYVMLIVLFFTACGIRNEVYPNWDAVRLQRMQETYHCIHGEPRTKRCDSFIRLYEKQGVLLSTSEFSNATSQDDSSKFRRELFQDRIKDEMKNRLNSYKLNIQIFGVIVDTNDLWLITGVLTAVVLWILAAHMQRHLLNLRMAKKVCPNNTCRDLLIMNQILTIPMSDKKRLSEHVRHAMLIALYWLPAVFGLAVIIDDIYNFTDGYYLLTSWQGTWVEHAARVISVLVVAYQCYRCQVSSNAIDKLIVEIRHTNFARA